MGTALERKTPKTAEEMLPQLREKVGKEVDARFAEYVVEVLIENEYVPDDPVRKELVSLFLDER